MRVCPECQSVHPDSTEFCPDDGTSLEAIGDDFEIAATAYGPAAVHDTSHQPGDGTGPAQPGTEHPREPPDPSGSHGDLVGKTVGGVYRVAEQIGVGGMGEVYRVEHVNLKKQFALKVLTKVAQDHPEAVERFKQEAISASHIDHDNIVDIITLDMTDDGHPYIVMELLKGESLAETLKQGEPLPIERALNIAYQICSALHAAHEDGIIHRDLKPENVFITKKGDTEFVKILDFGISKIHDAESDRVRITKTGQFLGTPLYMSPEQAKGESNLDRRVDIYSLGVLLYEMLEGHTPFTGENYFQLIWKHSNEEAPPMEGPAPETLKQVVIRALSKEARHRYTTMLDLEEALLVAVPDTPPPAFLLGLRPSSVVRESLVARPTRTTRSWTWLVAAGLGGALAIALVFGLRDTGEDGVDPVASLGPAAGAQDAAPHDPTVSNDGGGATKVDAVRPAPTNDGSAGDGQVVKVKVSIATTPPGAEVFLGDDRLGHTPLEVERDASSIDVALRVVKPGYRAVSRSVALDRDVSLQLVLQKARPLPATPADPGVPMKTNL